MPRKNVRCRVEVATCTCVDSFWSDHKKIKRRYFFASLFFTPIFSLSFFRYTKQSISWSKGNLRMNQFIEKISVLNCPYAKCRDFFQMDRKALGKMSSFFPWKLMSFIAIPNSILHAKYQLKNFIFKALTTLKNYLLSLKQNMKHLPCICRIFVFKDITKWH